MTATGFFTLRHVGHDARRLASVSPQQVVRPCPPPLAARGTTVLGLALACVVAAARAADAPPSFDEHVLPVFRESCCSCHNPDKRKGGLDLTSWGQTLAGGSSGEVIVAGDPAGSYLFMLVSHQSAPTMPPESDRLPDASLALIHDWIAGGAVERRGAAPVVRTSNAIATERGAALAPEGPPVMPPRLPLEVVTHGLRPTTVSALAASPHGSLVALGGRGQTLLYHAESLELIGTLPFPEGVIRTLRFSRNARLLLAGGGEAARSGRAVVWDVATGRRVAEVGEEFDEVLAADVSADQRLVVLGGPSKVVRLHETADGGIAHEIRKHTDWVTAVEFSPDGSRLATGDRAGNLFLWESLGVREIGTLKGHTDAITAVSWRPDGKALASVSEDGSVRLWDPRDARQTKTWNAHAGGGCGATWLRDGRLATTGRDKKVKLWKADGTLAREMGPLADIGTRVAASSDTTRIFAGDWAGALVSFTTADGRPAGTLDTNPPPLAERLAAAEKSLGDVATAERDAAERVERAAKALQLTESQWAAARQTMETAQAELDAATVTRAEAAKAVARWKAEVDFARRPVDAPPSAN